MPKLPTQDDLKSVAAPSVTPSVSVPKTNSIDYSPMAAGGKALAQGVDSVGKAFGVVASAMDEVDDYDTKKKLVEFNLQTDLAFEEAKRNVKPGAEGFQQAWEEDYTRRAKEFFGEGGANISPRYRQKVDLALVEQNKRLTERAQRTELDERDRFHGEDVIKSLLDLQNGTAAAPDTAKDNIARGNSLIDSSRLSPQAKDRLKRNFAADVEEYSVRGRIERGDGESVIDDLKKRPKGGAALDFGPDKDYSNASGREISQGIYQAFRNLGYTDFGAKTMVAEVHREHGGEFSKEHGSRRPFGFEWEPSPDHKGQVNFGFINSTRQRTAEIIAALDKEGLVSYDAPKSALNPKGIRVANSQRALDVMAAWYDNDLATNGARDPNAIIRGADPKELPKLLRDPNYNDVDDAHRRTAAWIQWQHPEIYGGRYRNGIAGQAHLNSMLANRRNLDGMLVDTGGKAPVTDDAGIPPEAFEDTDEAPYKALKPGQRLKLLNVARVALRAGTEQELRDAAEKIRRSGDDGAVDAVLQRATKIMTPNQVTKYKLAIDEARMEYKAIAPLPDLSPEEAEQHLDRLLPDEGAPEESYRSRAKVFDRAQRTWSKVEAERRKDPANAVGQSGEVKSAFEGLQKAQDPGDSPRQWKSVFEARVAAQTRVGIADYDQKLLTRKEAKNLLDMPDDASKMQEKDYMAALKRAADRAEQTFGPEYAARAFRDAIDLHIRGKPFDDAASTQAKRMAADIIAKVARNEKITRDEISAMSALQMVDKMKNRFSFVPREQEAAPQPQQSMPPATTQSVPQSTATPRRAEVDWLMNNPGQWQIFERKYGPGSAARYLQSPQP